MPALVLTQPINALAFVGDGVLFGAGGFKYASIFMTLAALPALFLILLGVRIPGPEALVLVWSGLSVLMLVRALSIMAAYLLKRGPFLSLRPGLGPGWTLTWGSSKVKLA